MVIKGALQPFERDGSTIGTKELTLHDLPWPASVLERAGAMLVQMKVTLSYFIKPNPGERGWTRGDREQSVHSIMNTDSGDHEHLFAPA